jgi:dienelactone hydrolase
MPASQLSYYDYPPKAERADVIVETKKHKKFTHERIDTPLTLPSDIKLNKLVKDHPLYENIRMDYYVPNDLKEGEKRPVIVVSPILGGDELVALFAKYYASKGMISVMVHRKKPKWQTGYKLEDVETHLRIAVIRVRQAIDWLEERPEVDKDRIGTLGISYGSIMHANLIAVDKRSKINILCFTGAPITDVLIDSDDGGIKKRVEGMMRDYGFTKEEAREELKKVIKSDPKDLAKYVDPEEVIIYLAAFDRVVKAKYGMELWKAMGKPKLKMAPLGHYSSVLLVPIIGYQSYNEFKRRLGHE